MPDLSHPRPSPVALRETHHSTVTEDQIDHLGHMNVRFYGVNARRGSDELLATMDLGAGASFQIDEVYTRHHREQLLGVQLVVRSGFVAADRNGVVLYHELADVESGTLAATFFHRASLVGGAGDLPPTVQDQIRARCIDVPAHGATRSIDLTRSPIVPSVDLEVLRERGLAMRRVREIPGEECNDDGTYREDNAPFLTWGGEPVAGNVNGPMLHDGPAGERMGWAAMETRMAINRLPSLGDHIQSFGALVDMADKTSHRVQWAFDVDRGDLLCSFEVVNLAFDTVARRAMSIPPQLREEEAKFLDRGLLADRATFGD